GTVAAGQVAGLDGVPGPGTGLRHGRHHTGGLQAQVHAGPPLPEVDQRMVAYRLPGQLLEQRTLDPLVRLDRSRAVVHRGVPLAHLVDRRVLPYQYGWLVEPPDPEEVGGVLRADAALPDRFGQAQPAQQLHAAAAQVVPLG